MITLSDQVTPGVLDDFVPIALATLEALDRIDCDLYVDEGQPAPVLYRAEYIPITLEDFANLRQRGTEVLYVNPCQAARLQERLRENLDSVLHDERFSCQRRFGLLQAAVSVEIHHAFRLINVNAAVKRSTHIGQKISELLRGAETLPADLFGVVRHDYYTFTHVTNAAGYAVLLAERLGIRDPDDLRSIATGALLHDFGKRLISPVILNQPGRPGDRDWRIIQAHPQTGYEELLDREELSHEMLMMVYQHHEKLDGSGYPVRAAGDDIHPWARLCTVVDIFDAMTCNRPYRKAVELSTVLEYLEQLAGRQLDGDMVACWTSTMRTGK